MARFSYVATKKGPSFLTGVVPTLLLFIGVVIIFIAGTGSLAKGSVKRQRDSLTDALHRDIVYCYATTGAYPESLDDIVENYGLYYDEELFYVDYKVRAKNIIPEVTIIDLDPDGKQSNPFYAATNYFAGLKQSWQNRKMQMKQNIINRN